MSVFFIAAAMPLLVAAAPPVRLEPSGPWVLEYADNSCILSRQFGSGSATTKLLIESKAPESFDLLVMGLPVKSKSAEVPGRFAPIQGKPMLGRVVQSSGKETPGVLWGNIDVLPDAVLATLTQRQEERRKKPKIRPPARSLAERAEVRAQRIAASSMTTEIEVEPRKGRLVILATGSLGEPIRMLEKCNKDSLSDWGVDATIEDKIVRPVWPVRQDLGLTPSDYPKKLAAKGRVSVVKFRLLIDADGQVTKCTAFTNFDEPGFNDVVCAVVTKRARFLPAELGDGSKVRSYYANAVHFLLAP